MFSRLQALTTVELAGASLSLLRRCAKRGPPNMRVQRTRRLASLGRARCSLDSPLTRRPLGATGIR